jgi:hypothetical protein
MKRRAFLMASLAVPAAAALKVDLWAQAGLSDDMIFWINPAETPFADLAHKLIGDGYVYHEWVTDVLEPWR